MAFARHHGTIVPPREGEVAGTRMKTKRAASSAHALPGRSQLPLRPDLQRLPVFGLAFFSFAVVTIMVFKLLIATQ